MIRVTGLSGPCLRVKKLGRQVEYNRGRVGVETTREVPLCVPKDDRGEAQAVSGRVFGKTGEVGIREVMPCLFCSKAVEAQACFIAARCLLAKRAGTSLTLHPSR